MREPLLPLPPALSSWVRADRAHLDAPLRDAVLTWLHAVWPFDGTRIDYAPR
ncbi:hypothetical protein [Streptomyces yangpuensis]|uniref:hypothetical protein n=1 Tax=Streptomyces yangpuensis TaxID=1648182 RepID=UPI000A6D40BC|nr:hypothetical protein [Streptomyces yangpuensis]